MRNQAMVGVIAKPRREIAEIFKDCKLSADQM
jgi:hypothetical protein